MTSPTATAEIERLAALLPGEWIAENMGGEPVRIWRGNTNVCVCWDDDRETHAAYIAAVSPDVVLGMIAALRAAEAERDEIRDKCCGCLTPDEKDETIAELSAERDKLREALEQISKPRYGLDTNANVHEGLEYWENIALGYRKSARAALQSTSAKEGE